MAGTKAPLFGLDASGTLAKSIVFSKWRGRTYVRRHTIPKNPKSGLQVGQRAILKYVTQDWSNLASTVQDDWETLASGDNITELNAMVRDAGSRARRNLGIRRSPDDASSTTPDAPTVALTAGVKSIDVAITPGATAAQYVWYAFIDTSDPGSSFDISKLNVVKSTGDTSFTITGLTTGQQYHIRVMPGNNDGELGSMSSDQNATPT